MGTFGGYFDTNRYLNLGNQLTINSSCSVYLDYRTTSEGQYDDKYYVAAKMTMRGWRNYPVCDASLCGIKSHISYLHQLRCVHTPTCAGYPYHTSNTPQNSCNITPSLTRYHPPSGCLNLRKSRRPDDIFLCTYKSQLVNEQLVHISQSTPVPRWYENNLHHRHKPS